MNPFEEIMKKYMSSNNPLSKKKKFHKGNYNRNQGGEAPREPEEQPPPQQ